MEEDGKVRRSGKGESGWMWYGVWLGGGMSVRRGDEKRYFVDLLELKISNFMKILYDFFRDFAFVLKAV